MDRRLIYFSGPIVLIAILCWFFPLFHIRPLTGAKSVQHGLALAKEIAISQSGPLSLEAYAPSAIDLTRLYEAFDADAANAKIQFGKSSGLGGAYFFCVSGEGIVSSVEKNRAVVSMAGTSRQIHLDLGVVVDNTVREAIGIKASAFANSQQFNETSTVLNRQVEEQVVKPNRDRLVVGANVSFTGCTKIGTKSDLDSLSLVPIRLHVLTPIAENLDSGKDVESDSN